MSKDSLPKFLLRLQEKILRPYPNKQSSDHEISEWQWLYMQFAWCTILTMCYIDVLTPQETVGRSHHGVLSLMIHCMHSGMVFTVSRFVDRECPDGCIPLGAMLFSVGGMCSFIACSFIAWLQPET